MRCRAARPCLALVRRARLDRPGDRCRAAAIGLFSRTVTALPHQSTASPATNPRRRSLSAALAKRAARRPGREHHVHRARAALRLPELRVGVPGRLVRCAVPPGCLTLSAAPLASRTADPSDLPYLARPSTQPKAAATGRAVITEDLTCFTYPQPIPRSDVRHTFCITGTYPTRLTARLTRFAFRGL